MQAHETTKLDRTGLAVIVAAWGLWAMGPIVVRLIGTELPPLLLGGVGKLIGGAVLCSALRGLGRDFRKAPPAYRRLLLAQAVAFTAAPTLLYVTSIQMMNPGLVSAITRSQMAFATILACALLGERMGRLSSAGVLTILAGNAVLLLGAIGGGVSAGGTSLGWTAAFGAAILWAGATVSGKALLRVFRPSQIVAFRMTVAGALLLLAGLAVHGPGPLAALSGRQIGLLFIQGAVTTALAYTLYTIGLRRVEVYVASAVEPMAPMFTLFVAVFLLRERIAPAEVAGVGVLLAGAGLVIFGRVLRGRAPAPAAAPVGVAPVAEEPGA